MSIVPRSAIGVADPGTRPLLAPGLRWLLAHYTGVAGFNDASKDVEYAKSVAAYGAAAGKSYEYSYLVGLGGTVFEQAGNRRAAHCLNFNADSYGVLLMLGVGVQPTAAMINSFRWLRHELVTTGQLHVANAAVPHYRFRATACPGITIAARPGSRWNSPTGEGSLGDLYAPFLTPWTEPTPAPNDGDDMFLIKQADSDAIWLVIPAPRTNEGRYRSHIIGGPGAGQWPAINATYGPVCTVTNAADYGPIVGA